MVNRIPIDTRMDVSVVIPSYNRANLLPSTLDAVLAQSLSPCEVIVVDDGSQDDTLAAIGRYAKQIRVITIENSGSIVARNVGLRAAVAPLVAFCDSDDLWTPEFLAGMAALWQAEPRCKVAYSNFHLVHADGWSEQCKFDAAPPQYWAGVQMVGEGLGVFDRPVVEQVIRWQPFFPSALVADRVAMLQAGGWDEGVGRTVGDDFGTVLRLAELQPFGVAFAPLVGIRKHAGNFSADVRAMNLGDANILEHALRSRPSLTALADLIRRSVAQRRRDALDGAFAAGDFAAVAAIYAQLAGTAKPARVNLKRLVAGLPRPLASTAARLLGFAGAALH